MPEPAGRAAAAAPAPVAATPHGPVPPPPLHQNGGGYSTFSRFASRWCAKPVTFVLAFAVVIVWLLTGPLFGFSDTWQLVINTGTTIVTFLMVFLIHNAQSRDTEAIQLKLDELIRATKGAHNVLLDVEELGEEALEDLRRQYAQIAQVARDEAPDEPGAPGRRGQPAAEGEGGAADAASARQPAS
ncbi:low affinity iron permease family protein [Aquabacterium humicola]|uniref:low affinity iron permease family protein n=1 Tax=Aquabacterium humicola TaxID=3237377 RepID=UPI0032EC627C